MPNVLYLIFELSVPVKEILFSNGFSSSLLSSAFDCSEWLIKNNIDFSIRIFFDDMCSDCDFQSLLDSDYTLIFPFNKEYVWSCS